MFLQPYVKAKKGFLIRGYRAYCNEQYTVSGYLHGLSIINRLNYISYRLEFQSAILKYGNMIKNINFMFDIVDCDTNKHSICFNYGYVDSNKIKYEIYPSKQEIQVKLTEISANLINKVINYL